MNRLAVPLLAWTLWHCEPAAEGGDPQDGDAKLDVQHVDAVAAVHSEALKFMAIALPRDHSSHHPLDDEIAGRWFDLFIARLDARRLYFTEADIRRFNKYRRDLDDHARRGDLSFAVVVRRTYAQRLRESTSAALRSLTAHHDFTKDERFEIDPDGFAETPEARSERWRQRVKFEILDQRSSGLGLEAAVAKLRARYLRVAKQKSLDSDEELYELYLDAFARTFGPHTRYFGERTLAKFRD